MFHDVLRLGIRPEFEAKVSKRLYMSEGVDGAVVSEFETTVAAYHGLDHSAIAERLANKYGGDTPEAVGFIAMIDSEPVAMAFGGPKDYESPEGIVEGVNVSAWVLKQARGLGVGKHLMRACVMSAVGLWNERKIWTSIDRDNIASQKMCQAVGFMRVHPQLEPGKETRDIYVM